MADKYVGQRVDRVDARDKVAGKALYSADYYLEDMLYIKVLRAPHPHALIKSIDVSRAREVPGVVRVITAADVPWVGNFGLIFKDQEVLVREKTRYMGDALAIVAAETEDIARRALEYIEVDYEPLPVISDPLQAMKKDAIYIHEPREESCEPGLNPGNLLCSHRLERGDLEQGMAEADLIVENEIRTPHVEHVALQPEAGVAKYDKESGVCTMWAATQWLHDIQADVAQSLQLNLEQVQIIQPAIGGAFGKREDVSVHIILALMAILTERPVKMEMTREELMITQNKRHPIIFRYKTGVKKDGTITAWEAEVIGDTGAYASTGSAVVHQALYLCTGPYNVPHLRGVSHTLYTNNTYSGAMRGFGATQAAFAYETQMDCIAAELDLDPLELRRKNAYELGSITPNGQVLTTSVGMGETLDRAAEVFGYEPGQRCRQVNGKLRGIGVASSMFGCGYGEGFPDHSIVDLEVSPAGKILIRSAAADVGQGVLTVISQIVAEVLDIPLDLIELAPGDTHTTRNAGSTSATRQTIFSGNAARIAAEELLGKIYHRASIELVRHHPQFLVQKGEVILQGTETRLSLAELARIAREKGDPLQAEGCYFPRTDSPDPATGQGELLYLAYTFNTHITEVEVDPETGLVRVLRVVAVPDVGRVINRTGVEGQSEGGTVMGLGMALMEKQVIEEGITLNADLSTYLIPTAMDMPEIKTEVVESGDAAGPFGAKGIGEPALLPAAPAIINAIYSATGIRFRHIPVTPDQLLTALQNKEQPEEGD